MDRPHLTRGATDLLAAAPIDIAAPPPSARRDGIALLAAALEERHRLLARRRIYVGAAAMLAVAASVAFVVRNKPHDPSLPLATVEGSASVVYSTGSNGELRPGDHVVSPGEGAVVLKSGTRVSLAPHSDVAITSVGKTVALDVRAGLARFDVTKLATGERFLVRTIDSEIEVRGTKFSVSLVAPEARCGASPTRVVVSEGIVSVRHGGSELQLHAGDSWPTCAPAPPTAVTASPPIAPVEPTPPLAPSAPKNLVGSDLGAQNDLFAAGIAAKRRGDREAAVRAFDQLLLKWPASPHAENAAVERFRLSSGTRAVSFARAYLARWPNGVAAAEARAIAQP